MKNQLTKNPYIRKLNGYRASHRNKWLLVASGILSQKGLMLYQFYIDIFDYDPRHDSYGTFEADFIIISEIFRCSENTVRNWHNELIEKKLVSKVYGRRFKLHSPTRYITVRTTFKGRAKEYAKAEKDQPIEKIFQTIAEEIQIVEESLQPVGDSGRNSLKSDAPINIGSSKVESKFVNSMSTYPEKEGEGGGVFTEEDQVWIDDNLS